MRERVAAPGRARARGDVGHDVPLAPACGSCAREATKLGLRSHLLDLRRRRLPAADGAGLPRARPRPQALPAAARSAHQIATSRTSWSTTRRSRDAGGEHAPTERTLAEVYTRYQRAAAAGQRARLRRPDHDHGQPAAGLPRRRRALPPAVPARAGRRVPGHQPRAVRAGARAGRAVEGAAAGRSTGPVRPRSRRPSSPSSATPTSRSTPSAAPPSATSSSSRPTTRTPGRSCSSRTTARPRPSSPPPTRSSPANPDRKPKSLWTDAGAGAQIVGYVADNEHDEAAFVAEEIDRLQRRARRPARRRRRLLPHQRPVPGAEEVFIRVGLPYKVVGGTRFYERKEVKDALAYLRVLANPDDTVNLRRILNVPKRGIGDRAEAMVAVARRARADRVRRGAARADEAPGIATRVAQRDHRSSPR